MGSSFLKNRYSSLNLHPYGTDLVEPNLRKYKTEPVEGNDKIILSTGEETIHLDSDDLDKTVLRNILYCYDFLDTNDKEYVNSSEAELYIRQVKDENPQLFDLLYEVIQVVSEYNTSDTIIAKNLFINRLKNHIKNLNPEDNTSVHSLKSPSNPLSDYFKNQGSRNSKHFKSNNPFNNSVNNPSSLSEPEQSSFQYQPNVSSTYEKESVSKLNPNDNELNQEDNPLNYNKSFDKKDGFSNKYENVKKFQTVKEYQDSLNEPKSVDEYIVFTYNNQFDWEESLRELS